jgi:hypothetical protein
MATFNNTFIFDAPAIGSPAASWGSNLFVVHNAAHVADTKWNEPIYLTGAYTDGVGLDGTNSQEIIAPSAGLSLELYIVQDDASAAADCTVLCGVFGKVPTKDGVTGIDRKWPSDVGTGTAASTVFGEPADMWIPLQNLEAVWVAKDNATESTEQCETVSLQTDATLQPVKFDVASTDWFMYKRTSVYLAGCKSICVGVQATDSLAASAMIVGRFVG